MISELSVAGGALMGLELFLHAAKITYTITDKVVNVRFIDTGFFTITVFRPRYYP
jgi:hypothetical protein